MSRLKHPSWLSECRWDWLVKLELDFGPSTRRRALEAFWNWLEELEVREGGRHFRWVRVLRHDADWRNICLYVLIGGLRSRRRYFENHWAERNGRARIERFDPSLHGIESMLKTIDRESDPDIEYGLPRRKTPKER